jgi:hypothetical protein
MFRIWIYKLSVTIGLKYKGFSHMKSERKLPICRLIMLRHISIHLYTINVKGAKSKYPPSWANKGKSKENLNAKKSTEIMEIQNNSER